MRVAGIDCGTNSIRLLIADVPGERGPLDDVVRLMDVVRLGQGVDRTGQFDPVALERTLTKVGEYADLCREHGVESIRFAATSATRDASNRDEFLSGVRERLGVPVQVLTGDQEAGTSFDGAASVMGVDGPTPVIVVDLGGGSTEVVLGELGEGAVADHSMNVGCVRMHERHMASDPATAEEIAAARADVNAALDAAEQDVDFSSARGLVGLAGTVTTLTARALGLEQYDASRIHGTELTVDQVVEVCEWFIHSSKAERDALGYMHPGRSDVMAAGALVWEEVVKRVAARMEESGHPLGAVVTSEHDILDGMALWAAKEPQPPR
ncbi:MAG: Ppx/GppA phosphatase family protein [Ancrocorticia sp.]|uniref:Exopolyphosphatase n=1 Tax=Ancrocorticia populi TaxID=2175228 RepID=A0A2V1K749_9ACTO|nr:Ppx/GppA phosphatase family protein [Ancrocorticia populi]MDN6486791.1 Ppx/GppA family phosphatase [Ancrocorticia sp.]PWF27276.1 exopolyphosphatase [Ancrocorticia populi]